MDETAKLKARIQELEGMPQEPVVAEEEPVEPEKPKRGIFGRPKKVQEPVEEPKEVASQEDRSAFNCPECQGEGLIARTGRICEYCHGTGKS